MFIMLIITFFIGAAIAITYALIYAFNAGYIIGGVLLLMGVVCTLVAFLRRKKGTKRFSGDVAAELAEIDEMTGLEFEQYAADLFEDLGYEVYRDNAGEKIGGDHAGNLIIHIGGDLRGHKRLDKGFAAISSLCGKLEKLSLCITEREL